MWIVRLALRRPYTFVVSALLVAMLAIVTYRNMPTDIFPEIDIPVISIVFNYTGMPADDMEKRIVSLYERFLTTTVNDIEHTESQSLNGVAVIKVFFQKNAKIEAATAQITAVSQTAIRQMPPGTSPPLIIRYNAASVPILQLSIRSDTLSEQQLFDKTVNVLRPQLVTLPGVQIPYPYGGKQRQMMVDIDPEKLYAYGISPLEVSQAINVQNLILPAGSSKIGTQEYQIKLNSSPEVLDAFSNLPIKTINGTTLYIKDVASVRDGFSVQTNMVHGDGKRGVLLSILKSGGASTLDVVDNIKRALPQIMETMPPEIQVTPIFDQSIFVRASVEGVIKEGIIAAALTGLMILLFLGNWRSTLVVIISIPLSIAVSMIILSFLGHTLNVMTLGGMALAVGLLVDVATVAIENIHRNLHMRKRLVTAILDGAQQIAVPSFVATICICIVFVPVGCISGAAKFLFTPLAMAVVFAMLTSYLLSRTLVPTMVHYLLASEVEMYGGKLDAPEPSAAKAPATDGIEPPQSPWAWLVSKIGRRHARLAVLMSFVGLALLVYLFGATSLGERAPRVQAAIVYAGKEIKNHWRGEAQIAMAIAAVCTILWLIVRLDLVWRVHFISNAMFEKFRRFYGGFLAWSLAHRTIVVFLFIVFVGGSSMLAWRVGTDFFPSVDAGIIRLHVRCPPGTRIEETEQYFGKVQTVIRAHVPDEEIDAILDNIGIPNSGINLSLSDGTLMSPADGEILISLKANHKPTEKYLRTLRKELAREFPDLTFFFAPADIVTQVLNFGLSAPIDIQIAGRDLARNEEIARKILADIAKVPGIVDARLMQVPRTPDIRVAVDRVLANQIGVTQAAVASDLLVSLSSNSQSSPNFWLDPISGVNYSILVQTPQYRMNSMAAIESTPVMPVAAGRPSNEPQLLTNLAQTSRGTSATNITHYNIPATFDVAANVQGTDLGSAARAIDEVVAKYRTELPRGSTITVRGQVESMRDSFTGLSYGLVFAIVLVYLIMVINFQSWLDPLIILMALPGAAAGILWMLWATNTTISVPALMGAIMSIGVATANSILVITFANDQRAIGMNAHDAALSAGLTRLRPVVMTAFAMIIGMLPMSLGLGEGGEQNAPLGRAVIGGLLMATFATLFLVPVVYSLLRRKPPQTHIEPELQP